MGLAHGIAVAFLVAPAVSAQHWPQLKLIRYAQGLLQPTAIVDPADGSGRLFIAEQAGRIRIVRNGTLVAAPFLDISSHVGCCGERGLLGLAFPPAFSSKRRFYVYYTNTAGDITVSRFAVSSDPDRADPASESVLLTIEHRTYPNHNGGQIAFGPDGFLYIGTGDGGGGGDPFGNGQNTNALLAKILRIDVEGSATGYAIPPGNPFAAGGGRPEVWAYGLRNPWRFSFDAATGDLYIADVGQNAWEEINFQPHSSRGGENYGWSIMEGNHCYRAGCSSAGLVLPVAEYGHGQGDCSVTGGYVYRGALYPDMQGVYFYADYCTGGIWGLRRTADGWASSVLLEPGFPISTFGQDTSGELYLADYARGDIYRITSASLPKPQRPPIARPTGPVRLR